MFKSQTFEGTKTQYKYDEDTDSVVELPDKIDVKALTKSSLQTSLTKMLDAMLPNVPCDDGKIAEYVGAREAFDDLDEIHTYCENLREKYGFSDINSTTGKAWTLTEMTDALKIKASNLKDKLNIKEQMKTEIIDGVNNGTITNDTNVDGGKENA